jgi:hypothetical protein
MPTKSDKDHIKTNKEIIKSLQDRVAAIKQVAMEEGKLSNSNKELLGMYRNQLKAKRSLSDRQQSDVESTFNQRNLERQITENLLLGDKSRVAAAEIQQQQLKLQHDAISGELSLTDQLQQRVAIEDAIAAAEGFKGLQLAEQLNPLKEQLNVMGDINEFQSNNKDILDEYDDAYKSMFGAIEKIKNKVKRWGDLLETSEGRMVLMRGAGLAIAGAFALLAKNAFDFAQSTGLAFNQMGTGIALFGDEAKAILDNVGSLEKATTKNLISMKMLSFQYGVSADTSAKLLASMGAMGASSDEAVFSTIRMTSELARANGVAPAAVLEDMAGDMDTFASYAKDGGENMARAAVQARMLGVNLGTSTKIADSLLDFESSIEKQMEASMLIGRNLNYDAARRLALNDDIEGAVADILSQMGSVEEFNRLNVLQKRALAESIGVGVGELSKMVANQEKLNNMNAGQKASQLLWEYIADALSVIVSYLPMIGAILAVVFGPMMVAGAWALLSTMGGLVAASWGLTASLLANPITWIVLGVVALIAGVVLLAKHLGGFGNLAKKALMLAFWPLVLAWEAIKAIKEGVGALIAGVVLLAKHFGGFGNLAKKALMLAFWPLFLAWEAIKAIKETISSVGSFLGFGGGSDVETTPIPTSTPSLSGGGTIEETGLAKVHKGETVGTFDLETTNKKLDALLTALGPNGALAKRIGGQGAGNQTLYGAMVSQGQN